jgi:hypothetical protein
MNLDEAALRTAIKVLRDTLESGRMPSGLKLEPDSRAMHEQAVHHLELVRYQVRAREAR